MWHYYGERERFAFEIGPPDCEGPTTGTRRVDVYAAGRWLTCDDNTVYVQQFVYSLEGSIGRLLRNPTFYKSVRPYPELSIEENFRQLLVEAEAGATGDYAYRDYLFMDWGPTSDNVSSCLFREGETVHIAFSFWRESHHDPSELDKVFVAELPERELLLILHRAAWDLAQGRSRG